MSAWAEQHRTVIITERRVVSISCHSVGAWFLLREGDVILHSELLLILACLLCHLCLEQLQMVVANRKVHVGLAVARRIESSLNEMFLHWSAWTVLIVMEQEQTLWQLTIVQSLWLQHIGNDSLVVTIGYELHYLLTLVLLALVAERLTEGKLLDILEEILLEVSCRNIIVSI